MSILMLLFKDIHYDARVQREARALGEAGYSVTIGCLQEYPDDPPELGTNVTIKRVSLRTKRLKRSAESGNGGQALKRLMFSAARQPVMKLVKDIWANAEYYRAMRDEIMNRRHYAVIHCHDLNTLPAGYWLARRFQLKLVYDSHEIFNEMAGKNKLEKWIGRWIEKRLLSRADAMITVNEHLKNHFIERYGSVPPMTILQNVPEHHPTKSSVPNDYFRSKYGLDEQDILLLYQGGLNPHRGLDLILSAMERLPDRYKLILLGDGRIRRKLEQIVQLKNLAARVFFHDQVPADQLLGYTRQTHIGLVMYENTSLNNYLSTPNKVFEYMAAGIPTIASDHPGKQIVELEGTGVCVEETPEDIVKAIHLIQSKYDEYRERCLRAASKYTWDQEKEKLIRLYCLLLEGNDEIIDTG